MSSLIRSEILDDDDENTLLIDYNDIIAEKIEQYQAQAIKRRELRYQKMVDDFFRNLEYDEEGKPLFEMDEDGYAIIPLDDDGHPLIQVDEEGNILNGPSDEGEEPEFQELTFSEEGQLQAPQQEDVEALLEEARLQAQEILDSANEQIEALQAQAIEEGREQGYQDGIAQGLQEYQQKEAQLEAEKNRLQEQFEAMQLELEKDTVEMVCDIVEKAFLVSLGDQKELLYHLAENAVLHIENSNVFIIKVNEENAAFLKEQKESLQEKIGSEAQLDIVIDPVMDESHCVIETDGGVFDCGIDTQLHNLLQKLKILSR